MKIPWDRVNLIVCGTSGKRDSHVAVATRCLSPITRKFLCSIFLQKCSFCSQNCSFQHFNRFPPGRCQCLQCEQLDFWQRTSVRGFALGRHSLKLLLKMLLDYSDAVAMTRRDFGWRLQDIHALQFSVLVEFFTQLPQNIVGETCFIIVFCA